MPVTFPQPLPTQGLRLHVGFFFNADHPVLLKYSLCLSLHWRWLQFAVCVCQRWPRAPRQLPDGPVPAWVVAQDKASSWGTGKGLGCRRFWVQSAPGQGWQQGWQRGLVGPPWDSKPGEGWWGASVASARRCCRAPMGGHRSCKHLGWLLAFRCG